MAIVKMKKFNLFVLDTHKDELLRQLQLFRNVQFEDVVEEGDLENVEIKDCYSRISVDDKLSELEEKINKCNYSIDLINKYSAKSSALKDLIKGLPNYTFEEMEREVSDIDFEREFLDVKKLGDRLSLCEASINKKREMIKELEPYIDLDVDFESMNSLKKFNSFVGSISGKVLELFKEEAEKLGYTYIEEISVYKDDHQFFVISDKREEDSLMEFFRITNFNIIKNTYPKIPKDEISKLNMEIDGLIEEKREIVDRIASKSSQINDFKLCYEYFSNLKLRLTVQEEFLSSKNVCLIRGYCPEFDIRRMEAAIQRATDEDYSIEYEDVDKNDENIPIMLKNSKLVRVFENVTSTYALPRYNEIDPTPLYAPIYALFFGMMSADVGYGGVLFILTTLGLKFCNLTPNMKKNVKFFQLISISTIVWGVLYGSYYAMTLPKVWRVFDMSKDFMTILVISIIFGGIHLAYGLAIKGYMLLRDKRPVDMFFDVVAWYITLAGIIMTLLSSAGILESSMMKVYLGIMIIGMVLLVIGGGRSTEGGIITKFVGGLYNVYGISGYIGDFVSYSRLMALGMSGGYIAFAINMIAGMVAGNSVIGTIIAIIILVVFHAFNLFLTCLGAYVHSLRLIYVEFFGKFYEGGGKAFRYFRKESKYINLDRQLEE